MIKNKVLPILMLGLLCVSMVSASWWDPFNLFKFDDEKIIHTYDNNIKAYNSKDKELVIKDLSKENKVRIKLITPLNYQRARGYTDIAQYEVHSIKSLKLLVSKMELYNITGFNSRIDRQIDFKIKTIEQVSVNDYETICKEVYNKTTQNITEVCVSEISGSHLESRIVWNDLDKVNFKKDEKIIVGLFTEVKVGDYIEWIPTFQIDDGDEIRVEEWASWTESLNTDIIGYWNFDQTTGTDLPDVTGKNVNGTLINMEEADWVSGKLGNALIFDGTNEYVNTNFKPSWTSTQDVTICMWFKTTSTNTASHETFGYCSGSSCVGMDWASGMKWKWRWRDDGGTNNIVTDTGASNDGNWQLHCLVRDVGEDKIMTYRNAVNEANATDTTTQGFTSSYGMAFMARGGATPCTFQEGTMDEVGIWNRSLSQAEIIQLYNSGTGMTYIGDFNTVSTITANITKPDIVNQNTDYLVNLTIEDLDVGDTLTGYVQFYVNSTLTSAEQSAVAVNGTTTLIGTLSYGNFSGGDNLTAQVWAGDGTTNTTKVYLVSSIVTSPPSVTNLIEFPTDPATFSQSTIYGFNATVTDNGDLDDIILEFNGTNHTATNISADIFNVSFANLSVGVYNYRWFVNDSEGGINNSVTGSYTVNQAISEGTLTSNLGWTINETQEVTIGLSESQGGDDDVTYVVSRDNVAKGTGETWSPAYGTYSYVLNTTGGVNWSENISMDTQTLTVNDNINPNIIIDFPVDGSGYNSVITELNYTATDTNLNTCWYSLNGGLANTTITCGDDVTGLNSGQGSSTWQMWVNDSDNNINTTTTTFFVDTVSPLVTNLIEFPTDPQTYSLGTVYHFNATIADSSSSLDDIFLEFDGVNYTATNISANIFNVSFTNLQAGVYNYRWFVNDSEGGINNSVTGSYTVSKATSQVSLTFNVASPQTYGTAITPTCSVTVGDGPSVLKQDGVIITSGASITLGADTYSFNCSYAENANYTGSQNVSSYTINKAIPTGSLTSNLGWAINEGQEVIIGLSEPQSNDGDVVYIVHRDNVEKGTGETWIPAYGSYTYLLNTTGGANWTVNSTMNFVDLVVSDNINPNIVIDFPVNNTNYGLIITELNYTANDTNLNTCWYSLNNGTTNTTVTCGDDVTGLNSGEGTSTWQIWANDSDNNINTTTTTFFVDTVSPNITSLNEYPSDPSTYSLGTIYHFNVTITDSSTLDDVILEFNGINYTATNVVGDIYNITISGLMVGNYNYRWFANDTLGNFNNTEIGTYTVDKATPSLTLTATTPIIYGTTTDFSGGGCPAELNCSLDITNNVYAAGIITGNYSTAGNFNYTSACANFTVTINKASLIGSITGVSVINYTNVANVTANETNNNDSDVTYILYRDNVTVSNPDNMVLEAGTYYYHYNSTGGENYTSNVSINTFTLTIDKATAEVYAYVGNLRANYLGDNLTARNEYLNGSLNIGLGDISMYLNDSLIASGASPLFYITDFPLGSYYFNVTYDGNDNYTLAEEHWSINITEWYLANLTGVFNLNVDTGDVAYDISGNENNGTIYKATWGGDDIDITLIDGFDYSINKDTGLFILLNDARDKTLLAITYTYYEYDEDFLGGIIIKILPGLLIMLVLIMIIRFFINRGDDEVEEHIYEY